MLGTFKVSTLFSLFASVGVLLFSSIDYSSYTIIGPSSYKLRDTTKEHSRMRELPIIIHNDHNHNEAEHIHWDI